ncbi:unnamed protein product [Urochloa humidicola]
MTTPATGGVASRISSGGTRGQRHHVGRRIERGSPCRPPSPAGRQRRARWPVLIVAWLTAAQISPAYLEVER